MLLHGAQLIRFGTESLQNTGDSPDLNHAGRGRLSTKEFRRVFEHNFPETTNDFVKQPSIRFGLLCHDPKMPDSNRASQVGPVIHARCKVLAAGLRVGSLPGGSWKVLKS